MPRNNHGDHRGSQRAVPIIPETLCTSVPSVVKKFEQLSNKITPEE